MLINLSEILSSEGMNQEIQITSELKDFSFGGNVYVIDSIQPFNLTLTNEGKKKASLKADVKVRLKMLCDRCLDQVMMDFDVQIDELIDMDIFDTDKIDEINELNYLEDCNVDMDKLLGKELICIVPLQVLCKDDCKGLCKVCGTNLNHGSCSCDTHVPDPRLSVFANILNN
jgi:uncharacterized protein